MGLMSWFVVGLIAGLIARTLVRPGLNAGCIGTGLLGMGGSLVGGMIANLIGGDGLDFSRSGLLGSIIGSVVVFVVIRLVKKN